MSNHNGQNGFVEAEIVPINTPLKRGDYEEFAIQMGVHGLTARDAYRVVHDLGPDDHVPSSAWRWGSNKKIKARVLALKNERARREIQNRVNVTESEIITDLKGVILDAREQGKHAPAIKGLELLGKYLGLWDGKRESNAELEDLDDTQLQQMINEGQGFLESVRKAQEIESGSGGTEESEDSDVPPVP